MTGRLLETQLDSEQRDCAQTIQICANHLLGLLNNIPVLPETEPPDPPAAGSGPCVLVAEDNPVNRKVVIQQLQKLGCQTHAVTTGQEALGCLDSAAYDVILMDCQMPEMDGYEAARRIREREQSRTPPGHVPIIAITANAMQGDRDRCLAAGMDDYITKPIRPETLKSTLERWVPSYRPVQPADPEGQRPNPIPNTGAPADMDRLLEFSDHDEASLRELLTLYLTQTREQLDRIRAAIQGNAPRNVERLAHSCAGSSATCGMHPILAPLRALELLAGTGRLEGALPLHNQISGEFQRITDFLETELAARYPDSPPLPLE
jgi:CheY-like chemotaxis protein/HPt (histidine-containing phosphotransfer) domain-containing protein